MKKTLAFLMALMMTATMAWAGALAEGDGSYTGEWIEFEEAGFKLYIPGSWIGSDLTELLTAENRSEIDVMSIYGDEAMDRTVNIICYNSVIDTDMPIEEVEASIEGLGEYEGDIGTINGMPAIYYRDIGDDLSCVYFAFGDKLVSIAGGPISDTAYRPMFFQIVKSFTPIVKTAAL